MAWPTIFANLAAGNQPLSIFDNMFAQVAQLVAIPCTASGANAIVLTGIGNSPTLTSYNNFQAFRFKAAGNSSSAVTAQFAGLAALPVFQKDGVTQAAAGSLIINNEYLLVFDQSRNAGAGGFYLEDSAQSLATPGASPIWGPFTNIASAATTDLSTAPTIDVFITGTATITSFGSGINLAKVVIFQGSLTLTNGASLLLPGGINIQTAANDIALCFSNASAQWFVLYHKKSGSTNLTGTAGQVLTANGSGSDATFQALPGGTPIVPTVQLLTASQTVTIPTGATKCKVTLIGGGGGSGGAVGAAAGCAANGHTGAGGPGGPAGALEKYLSGLTPGNTLILTIGGAGSAGTNAPGAGGNGGDTTLASGTQTITQLTASHGVGGGAASATSASVAGTVGAAGTGTNGDFNMTGGAGMTFALDSLAPSNTAAVGFSVSGAAALRGPGQNNTVQSGNSLAGKAGTGFGSGAAGGVALSSSTAVAGAAGTAGAAIFEWYA